LSLYLIERGPDKWVENYKVATTNSKLNVGIFF